MEHREFGEKNYNYYSAYLRKKYNGKRVYKVIVDAGFTCPNRDGSKGYGGCSYCNVESFTPASRNLDTFKAQILHGMSNASKNYRAEKFIIYFQPNTNTYASVEELKILYDEALSINTENIVGLSIGTRPDCIDKEKILLLESYKQQGLEVDLEMGFESIYNETLKKINRGCSHEDLLNAMKMLENTTLDVCLHMIFGLPGESRDMMLAYANEINRFPMVNFVKFHHLHIVDGSIMGVQYKRKPFPLFSLEEYADFICEFIPLLRKDIVIQRLFGMSDPDMLIAPKWNLKKSQIQNYIDAEIDRRNVIQGSFLPLASI